MRLSIALLLFSLIAAMSAGASGQSPAASTGAVAAPQIPPTVTYDDYHSTSIPLRDAAQIPPGTHGGYLIPLHRTSPKAIPQPVTGMHSLPRLIGAPAPAVSTKNLVTFEGVSNVNGLYPPDPNAAVGATQVVETVNVSYEVFNKSGTPLLGPFEIPSIWAANPPFGGVCENGPYFSDPVVLYDHIAGRWLITEIASSNAFATGTECIAVSTSSDATGSYNRYAYSFNILNDYPKFGIWPDAYYGTYNPFSSGGLEGGGFACAYDRNAMIAGTTAAQICLNPPGLGHGNYVESFLPSDLDGSTLPPSGSPNYLIGTFNGGGYMSKFHVDFIHPSNSTISAPVSILGSGAGCGTGTGIQTCIPQPGTSERLDSLGDRLMYRLAYRNFGSHESLVTCASGPSFNQFGRQVLESPYWFEVRGLSGIASVYQSGVYNPDELQLRWMCSIAMDKNGNIALGYSISGVAGITTYPGIRVTGRLQSDPKGTMGGETILQSGGGSQTGTNRWGDYTSMSIDPTDDLTFFYTNEYYPTTSASNWHTRIASFQLGP
jgi:hypothetical protein